MSEVQIKAWFQSKTMLFNLSLLLVMFTDVMLELAPSLEGVVPLVVYKVALFAVGAINMILRRLTSSAVTFTGKKS